MSEENVTRIQLNGKEYILIGTAHVSKNSAEQVKEVVDSEQPDTICIELDEQRFQSVKDDNKWKNTDIFQIIRDKKAVALLMNLAVSSFQKRMAKQFGIRPGEEMIQGIQSAEETGAELVLADRDIQITFARIWGNISFKGKAMLLMQVFGSIFSRQEISEKELENMKQQDTINAMLQEFTDYFPDLKKPLIDERDQYLSQKIKDAPGNKVVAILGAAHVPGITKEIEKEQDLDKLTRRPPKAKWPKVVGWMIPVFIIAIIAYTFITNPAAGWQQTLSWILWNGSFSAIGALAAFAHPLTILTAFIVAPLTSLNPLLAAGWFAGFVQAYIKRPNVSDFDKLADDAHSVKGFWNNKVTRILLVVVLANIGSSLGTLIGGADVIRVFIQNLV
ncbi:TraB/GumN family protein [Oceanobacillus locisalsi]|uniref:TraB/GumN family protein n=1 Tax=Oceanobacillus locisalsi TaxID=546107 RepID=A0ABW3NIF8_9BACI